MDTMLSTIIGGVLAILASITTTSFAEWSKTRNRRRSLALAFAGEMGAILDIIDRRHYLRELEQLVEKNSTTPYVVQVRQNYFLVYESNMGEIGLLPGGLSEEVARFYIYVKSLVENATPLEPDYRPLIGPAEHLAELRDMLHEVTKIAPALVKRLQSV
jgi:hypothetical protein